MMDIMVTACSSGIFFTCSQWGGGALLGASYIIGYVCMGLEGCVWWRCVGVAWVEGCGCCMGAWRGVGVAWVHGGVCGWGGYIHGWSGVGGWRCTCVWGCMGGVWMELEVAWVEGRVCVCVAMGGGWCAWPWGLHGWRVCVCVGGCIAMGGGCVAMGVRMCVRVLRIRYSCIFNDQVPQINEVQFSL